MGKSNGWIGVDFDGTLAQYDKFEGPLILGAPVPRMLERVKEWVTKGIEVRIVTARVSGSKEDRDVEEVRKAIEDWTELHVGKRLKVTNEKDYNSVRESPDALAQG